MPKDEFSHAENDVPQARRRAGSFFCLAYLALLLVRWCMHLHTAVRHEFVVHLSGLRYQRLLRPRNRSYSTRHVDSGCPNNGMILN